MARRSPIQTLRTCTRFFTTANSPSWPGPTRRTTIKLLSLGIFFAIIQLGLCAALAHKLLSMRHAVECWEVDDTVPGPQPGRVLQGLGGSGGALDGFTMVVRTRRLPVTFVNLDRLEGREGVRGKMWLSLGRPGGRGGKLIIILTLIANPVFLILFLAFYLRAHVRFGHVTNRCAMVLAVFLGGFFLADVVGMWFQDIFPGGEVNPGYKTCWKDDGFMRALEAWGWWARSIVVSGAVVGVMGISTMIGYFFMALFAARMNQIDRERPIGLQDLGPSRRPAASGNAVAAGQNSASIPPSVPVPAAFSISSRLPRQQSAADVRGRMLAERKEETVNPFTDPQNVVT
ncbi:hypothetical protein COCMIDRAFT_23574 [Bipolaris oryzae ATCC 44560]|uniref:Uncharacterized protein n=1 Tax=Bipolaris oryzae ATCC 44560 TaxID=930090 RepID=W6ZFB1_COCMI|nr:uncharacterized protein COCMIDRAFT_23574 [Bipolaris oryzae ATCC 44560]EUC48598.1 hypothetical protein COCMIDRAFT_23574 [Bipolaris oryzae ATCC 44560]